MSFSKANQSQRGSAFLTTIILLGTISIVTLGINAFMNNSLKARNIIRTTQAYFTYQMYFTLIKSNPERWLDKQSAMNPTIASCLQPWPIDPTTGTFATPDPRTFSCPTLLAANNKYVRMLQEENHPPYLSSVDIYNSSGIKIAGTIEQPVKLAGDGFPCDSENDCPLQAVGLMKRSSENSTADPGDVSFHIVVEKVHSSHFLSNFAYKPVVLNQFVGKTWNKRDVNSENYKPSGVCDNGGVVFGLDSAGNVLCRGIQGGQCPSGYYFKGYDNEGILQCAPFSTAQCDSDHYAAGIKENYELVCNKFAPAPVPPPAPTLQLHRSDFLGSVKYNYKEYDMGFPVGAVTMVRQRSGSYCSDKPWDYMGDGSMILPPTYGFKGTVVWFNNGCRADVDIYVYK